MAIIYHISSTSITRNNKGRLQLSQERNESTGGKHGHHWNIHYSYRSKATGQQCAGQPDDELLDWRFLIDSTGVYLPARVLLRGGGCSWAIFNPYHTIYDIYIDISTRRSVAYRFFSRFGVGKTAPTVHIFVICGSRKWFCWMPLTTWKSCTPCFV
jgi:hypothetical protein